MPRRANATTKLLSQVNAMAAPNRNKSSDGWLGDAAHQATRSDHNPNKADVVQAQDITHDPSHGMDSYKLAETLRGKKDDRIKYVISNRKIFSGPLGPQPWVWRAYSGKNPHDQHVHVSVRDDPAHYDDARDWQLTEAGFVPDPTAPEKTLPVLRQGDKGFYVEMLQTRLGGSIVDGDFGPMTRQAVLQFQRDHKLDDDGIVGIYTWRELLRPWARETGMLPADPYAKLEEMARASIAAGPNVTVDQLVATYVTILADILPSNWQPPVAATPPAGPVIPLPPETLPAPAPSPPEQRHDLARGDTGPDVAYVQRTLGLPVDSDFGPQTEAGVKGFQGAYGLPKDGVVGSTTWAKLDELAAKLKAGDNGISDTLARSIEQLVANASEVQAISWPGRGKPPPGYYAGMAQTYAVAMKRLNANDPAAQQMAVAAGNRDTDALAWYASEFNALDMSNTTAGLSTLRHLFVLMYGLAMRESSGVCWEGRDMSATNVSADTCESGLFQSSWNLSSCSGEILKLLAEYDKDPNGFQPTFARALSPDNVDLDNYGSGTGTRYQFLAKRSPAFAVLMTAIGLRRLRKHWGPINRKEVTLYPAIDRMLSDVEQLVANEPPTPGPDPEPEPPQPPEPEPGEAIVKINIRSTGPVTVYVNNHNLAEMKSMKVYPVESGQPGSD